MHGYYELSYYRSAVWLRMTSTAASVLKKIPVFTYLYAILFVVLIPILCV